MPFQSPSKPFPIPFQSPALVYPYNPIEDALPSGALRTLLEGIAKLWKIMAQSINYRRG
jgi:hypothetical protein